MATGYKTGGRKKGVPNRLTKELRITLRNHIGTELDRLPSILNGLEPKERVEALIKLLPYIIPKYELTSIDVETEEDDGKDSYIKDIIAKYTSS